MASSRKSPFVLVWIALIVMACQAVPTPSPTSTSTHTLTPTVSGTPIPSATPTPTLTPYPSLAGRGPYLMYAKYVDGSGLLTIVDANLHGRKIVELPNDGYYNRSLKHVVSPDGKWLAFYAGSIIEPPYDLTLNLLSLPDGTTYPITKLFSSVYPKDLQPVVDFYAEQGYGEESFKNGIGVLIETLAWSPDGRYLAFAGQMDGPSSDLYIYDVQTQETRRLTDDLYVLDDEIIWSPDGKWLLINDAMPGALHAMHRIRIDRGLVDILPILEKTLEEAYWVGLGWISPTIYLMADHVDWALYNLRYLDVETGKIHKLWEPMSLSYAINPQDKTIAVNGIVDETADRALFGTFVVSLDGRRMPLSYDVDRVKGFLGGKNPFFLGTSDNGKNLVTFDSTGSVHVEHEDGYYGNTMLSSPDNKWFVFFDKWYGTTSLVLFSADRKQKKVFSGFDSRWVLWRGDSLGLFVAAPYYLQYFALPDANPIFVDRCLPDEVACSFLSGDLVWLP